MAIPRLHKEISIYKKNAISNGITEASEVATKYITHIDDDGITIHPVSTTADCLDINANGVQIYKNNTQVAVYGSDCRVGRSNGPNVFVDGTNADVNIRNGSTILAKFAANLIEIGKETASAIIRLCEGHFDIAWLASTSPDFPNATAVMQATNVAMKSRVDDQIAISGTQYTQGMAISTMSAIGDYSDDDDSGNYYARVQATTGATLNTTHVDFTALSFDGSAIYQAVSRQRPTGFQIGDDGTPIKAIMSGTVVKNPSGNSSVDILSASDVTSVLGSGAVKTNTYVSVVNGDTNAYTKQMWGYMTDAQTVKGVLQEAHTGNVRFNYLLVRFN